MRQNNRRLSNDGEKPRGVDDIFLDLKEEKR